MRQVISQNLTGRYAIIKIFPFIHALKVEVSEKFIDEQKNELTECRWDSQQTKTFSICAYL